MGLEVDRFLKFQPFCLYKSTTAEMLIEVVEFEPDFSNTLCAKCRVFPDGEIFSRPASWLEYWCRPVNEMEALAWASI